VARRTQAQQEPAAPLQADDPEAAAQPVDDQSPGQESAIAEAQEPAASHASAAPALFDYEAFLFACRAASDQQAAFRSFGLTDEDGRHKVLALRRLGVDCRRGVRRAISSLQRERMRNLAKREFGKLNPQPVEEADAFAQGL